MQGLPAHLLSKPAAKTASLGDKSPVKTEKGNAAAKTNDFSSMFEKLTGAESRLEKSEKPVDSQGKIGEPAEVQTKSGEVLKDLLASKNESPIEEGEVVIDLDPKQAQALFAALAAQAQSTESLPQSEVNVDQKLASTSSNLDQLLNSLKGTNDTSEMSEEEVNESLQGIHGQKGEKSSKGILKTESPLDFLMKGAKGKDLGELKTIAPESEASDLEKLLGQKNVMTAEDYLKNMESSEKKGSAKLALINGMELPKNVNQNVKAYGQGLTLLSDPLIKNTKDLAFKDGNKGKNASLSTDELKSPDMKIGAELSANKQDVIPVLQNTTTKNDQHNETQTQTNQKVLDLGKLNTSNTNEIIKRISDYVEQNQVANKSSLDLTVKHDSLGEFKIQVSKMPSQSLNSGSNLIDMQITTSSKEGQDFFLKNEVSLMKNLNNAGINLSDLRIVSSMTDSAASGQTDSRQSNSQNGNNSNSQQFSAFESGSFAGDSSNGKERRKELWEEYQQRYGA